MTTAMSELAEAILEDSWILCTPQEAVANAIERYLEAVSEGRPYTYDDDRHIEAVEFLKCIAEIIDHFRSRGLWSERSPF